MVIRPLEMKFAYDHNNITSTIKTQVIFISFAVK